MDRIGAEIRSDSPFFENRDRRRQRARPQQQREIARRLNGKAAGDDAAAAEDRLADHRGADDLVVEHDRKWLADIFTRRIAKALGAGGIEAEANNRLVVLKGRLGVDQRVAADHDALAHDIGLGAGMSDPALLGRQNFVEGRQPPAARVLDRDVHIDQLEGELRGAAEQRLDMLGVVDAGQLHQDAVRSLPLYRRLLGAGLVDPPPNDLDRLIDRLAAARLGGDGAEAHRPRSVRGDVDGQVRVDFA